MTREPHPYADPECKVCFGSGEMPAKHHVDGETVYVECWCIDEPVEDDYTATWAQDYPPGGLYSW